MSTYAAETSVSSDKSRAEIERTLARYGAAGFMYGWRPTGALVAFEMEGRRVQFRVPLPDRYSQEITHTPERGRQRSAAAAESAYEKAVRQRWRALALVIKAKLEAVESGITTFDGEFLAHIMLPDGRTTGEWMQPQLEAVYESGEMPDMIPALSSPAGSS